MELKGFVVFFSFHPFDVLDPTQPNAVFYKVYTYRKNYGLATTILTFMVHNFILYIQQLSSHESGAASLSA